MQSVLVTSHQQVTTKVNNQNVFVNEVYNSLKKQDLIVMFSSGKKGRVLRNSDKAENVIENELFQDVLPVLFKQFNALSVLIIICNA